MFSDRNYSRGLQGFLKDATINQYVNSSHILRPWEKKKIRQIRNQFKLNQKDAVKKYMFIKTKFYSLLNVHRAVTKSDAAQYISKADFLHPDFEKVSQEGIKQSIELKRAQLIRDFNNRYIPNFVIRKLRTLEIIHVKDISFYIEVILDQSKFYSLGIVKSDLVSLIKKEAISYIDHRPNKEKETCRLAMNTILNNV